jgi:hypothetical protein
LTNQAAVSGSSGSYARGDYQQQSHPICCRGTPDGGEGKGEYPQHNKHRQRPKQTRPRRFAIDIEKSHRLILGPLMIANAGLKRHSD